MEILEKQQRKMKNKLRKKIKLTHFLGQYLSILLKGDSYVITNFYVTGIT